MKQKQKTADPVDIYNLSDLEEANEELENDAALNRVLKKQTAAQGGRSSRRRR